MSEIKIVEKPDEVSWDEIHEVIWNAHAKNRENGVFMGNPSLPGEEIRKKVEGKGIMVVALDDHQLIGTAAIIKKRMKLWCGAEEYAYFCFDAVLPTHQGMGIYKKMNQLREETAKSYGMNKVALDTNKDNLREIEVVKKNGFKPVALRKYGDHYNIVFVKWFDGCPHSVFRLKFEFTIRAIKLKTKAFIKRLIK
ncbi:MAG: GNAT family N-acetyltransferase [Prevotella sp.]|nr:GNAT family N-acetyltransferase [Prevotella sp.]